MKVSTDYAMLRVWRLCRVPAAVLMLVAGSLGATCNKELTTIPVATQDKAPLITISNFVPGSNGEVNQNTSTTTSTVFARQNTELLFLTNARNDVGGVKTFSLTVSQNSTPLFHVQVTGTPDANNQVPTILHILGTDGAGGQGPNSIKVTMSSPVILNATAENFNGQSTSITVRYVPLGPLAANLSASPTNINLGQSSTLTWSTTNATTSSISPVVTNGSQLSGSAPVSPTATTTYTLTAQNPFEILSRTATLNVAQPPQAAGIGGAYTFDTVGTQNFSITVMFSGTLVTATGPNGATSFNVPVTQTVSPGGPASIPFTASGLRPGTWRVSAVPNCCGAPVQCTASVPGFIRFDVSGGLGARCL